MGVVLDVTKKRQFSLTHARPMQKTVGKLSRNAAFAQLFAQPDCALYNGGLCRSLPFIQLCIQPSPCNWWRWA
jgi:hypothetical protein